MKYFVTVKVCNKTLTTEEAKSLTEHCAPRVGFIEVGEYIEIKGECYRLTQMTNTLLDDGEIETLWILQAIPPAKSALLPVICVN